MEQPNTCTDPILRASILSKSPLYREMALEQFVRGSYDYISSVLEGYTINMEWVCEKQQIKDACNDAFVAFKHNTGKEAFSFEKEDICGYFFKIARNILCKRFDGKKIPIESYDAKLHDGISSNNPEDHLELLDLREKIRTALKALNPEDRTILTCYAEGYSIEETTDYMIRHYQRITTEMRQGGWKPKKHRQWKPGYTKTRLHRAKQKMGILLKPLLDG